MMDFITQIFWMQYTVHICKGQLGAHYPPLSFANSCSISTILPSLPFCHNLAK